MTATQKMWAGVGIYVAILVAYSVAMLVATAIGGFLMYMVLYVMMMLTLWIIGYELVKWIVDGFKLDKEKGRTKS